MHCSRRGVFYVASKTVNVGLYGSVNYVMWCVRADKSHVSQRRDAGYPAVVSSAYRNCISTEALTEMRGDMQRSIRRGVNEHGVVE